MHDEKKKCTVQAYINETQVNVIESVLSYSFTVSAGTHCVYQHS